MRPYEKLPIPTDLEIVHITLLVVWWQLAERGGTSAWLGPRAPSRMMTLGGWVKGEVNLLGPNGFERLMWCKCGHVTRENSGGAKISYSTVWAQN